MRTKAVVMLLLFLFGFEASFNAQNFYFGNDLSYANQMEDCGAVFKENNQPKNVYQIFADHGTNVVRVRLWVNPTWQNTIPQPQGVKPQYSNFEDVKASISRAKAAGMMVLLDLHYSDVWADPSRQLIPAAWTGVAYNLPALKDSVYNYTVNVLTALNTEGLMPDLVQVGNETNPGFLMHAGMNPDFSPMATVSTSWSRHAELFNTAIQAVRSVGATASVNPKIALHYAGLNGLKWWFQNITGNGVTDFDIIGFSYYYAWHQNSISQMGTAIEELKSLFPGKEIVALETGYLWTTQNFDAMPNIINTPDPQYMPVSPEKQLEYMVDYAREVILSGGNGVFFWEPAWVSTPCHTPWGVGSSHDHVVFFDPLNNNFMENGGGRWTEPQFYNDILGLVETPDTGAIKIYPNPATRVITVAFDNPVSGDLLLQVADLKGNILKTKTFISGQYNAGALVFDVSGLPAGMFVLKVNHEKTTTTKKFILK